MERNIWLKIAYDGSGFYGWQRQPDRRTVQGVLEEALSKFCDCDVQLQGTSRTDAGVHALGQCASFKGDFGIPVDRIPQAVNNYLAGGMSSLNPAGDVRILEAKEMPPEFHARYDCKGKTYRYIIRNSTDIDVFRKNYCYQMREFLDADRMKEAAQYIIGTHDFACFQTSGGTERETTVRTVKSLVIDRQIKAWSGDGGIVGNDDSNAGRTAEKSGIASSGRADEYVNTASLGKITDCDIIIEITGDGFLYNMVRIIVGTLIEVGLGKREPSDLKRVIESKDRSQAGYTAPAAGLYLKEIYY